MAKIEIFEYFNLLPTGITTGTKPKINYPSSLLRLSFPFVYRWKYVQLSIISILILSSTREKPFQNGPENLEDCPSGQYAEALYLDVSEDAFIGTTADIWDAIFFLSSGDVMEGTYDLFLKEYSNPNNLTITHINEDSTVIEGQLNLILEVDQ